MISGGACTNQCCSDRELALNACPDTSIKSMVCFGSLRALKLSNVAPLRVGDTVHLLATARFLRSLDLSGTELQFKDEYEAQAFLNTESCEYTLRCGNWRIHLYENRCSLKRGFIALDSLSLSNCNLAVFPAVLPPNLRLNLLLSFSNRTIFYTFVPLQ